MVIILCMFINRGHANMSYVIKRPTVKAVRYLLCVLGTDGRPEAPKNSRDSKVASSSKLAP
jgi:hypothetical protein